MTFVCVLEYVHSNSYVCNSLMPYLIFLNLNRVSCLGIKDVHRGSYMSAHVLLAHLSRSDKVSFCDQSLSVVHPLTIDLNDNSS